MFLKSGFWLKKHGLWLKKDEHEADKAGLENPIRSDRKSQYREKAVWVLVSLHYKGMQGIFPKRSQQIALREVPKEDSG